jgi:hypothetical protein
MEQATSSEKEPTMIATPPVLQLCPGCCTLDEILSCEVDPESVAPLVGCVRCSFTFPLLPGAFADLTAEAMHRHDCRVSETPENWTGVAEIIIDRLHELRLNQRMLAERSAVTMLLFPDAAD